MLTIIKYIILFLLIIPLWGHDTWEIIQESIWTPKCVMCHDHGLSFAEQSGLILAEDVAYEELVNVTPTNIHATEDGLELVGTNGITSLYSSFLWEKINANNYEHFYEDHPEYGSIMPLGLDFLTNGELEFIRQWIVAGAPETGEVADESLLQDTTIFEPPEFGPLEIPENGMQVHLPPFDVPPQFERELFYYVEVDTQDFLYINRITTTMRPGSHHFIVYTFDESALGNLPASEIFRDIRNFDGSNNFNVLMQMQFHKFISGTQTRLYDYSFPDGVALKIDPLFGFDLNSHYTNYSNDTITGEVYNNFYFSDPNEVEHVAEILSLNNRNITLPPNQQTTLNSTFWIEQEFENIISIFQLYSHAHKHNTEFKVYRVNQNNSDYRELVYISYDWNHPPLMRFDPPIIFDLDDGIELEATYFNNTDETISFGLLSTDEMMILFGLYFEGGELSTELEVDRLIPKNISIESIFPNPFNPTTKIDFSLQTDNKIKISVYDLNGREISTLLNKKIPSGNHSIVWNAQNQPTGVYFIRMESEGFSDFTKVMLIK